MKLSASIPDELWEKAGGNRPDASPSRILQRVLQEWLEDREGDERPAFAEPPADATAGLVAARIALTERGREIFQDGYRGGAQAAVALTWSQFEALHGQGFRVVEWLEPYVETVSGILAAGGTKEVVTDDGEKVELTLSDFKWLRELSRWLGEYAWPLSGRGVTDAYIRGFEAAVRDVWEAVERGSRLERAHRRLMGSRGTQAIERCGREAGGRWAEWDATLQALEEVVGWDGRLTVREEEAAEDEPPDWVLLADGNAVGFDAWEGRFSRSPHLLVVDPWEALKADGILAPGSAPSVDDVTLFWSAFREGAREVYEAVMNLETSKDNGRPRDGSR